jgi:RsiW-degrading membrane proteinase PrsW (M82 family)
MSYLLLALGVAALPAALILAYFIRLDRARPEPVGLIGRSVLYGFIAVMPSAAIELAAEGLARPRPGLAGVAFESFVVAALVEEGTKLFFVKRYIYRKAAFDERADGMIYAICVSLGFAFVENFLYGYRDLAVLFVRAFTAVPGHAVFSGVMGYYVGISKLEPGRKRAWVAGLAWAILLHGLYDFFLMTESVAAILVLPLLIIGWIALARLFKAARAADERDAASASYQSAEPPIL